MVSFHFNLPPEQNIEFLKAKKPKLSFNYDEIMHAAHLKAFTIAKVTKLDLLSEIQDSLIKAQSEGKSFESWKKDIKPTLAKKGWLGKVEVTNEKTGEIKTINVNNARLQRIYNTNMRTANAQGRAKAQYALEGEIYLRYIALQDGLTRPSHLKMHGVTLHRDDPFWETNYPPNGWNCRCVVRAYSKAECERQGFTISQTPPLPIASKDWSYDKRGLEKDESLDSVLETKLEKFKKNPNKEYFVESLNDTKADITQVKQNYQAILNLKQESKNGEADKKFIPIAKTTQTLKSLLNTEAKEIYLSGWTLRTHTHHTNVKELDYSLLPFLIRDTNVYKVKESGENHIVYFSRFGSYYRAVFKKTSNDEIFLQSLVKGNKEITK
ncbi:phage minor head protein [Helicobacter sp.]|uniref:phage head morphogenesis protein n=1 Tax=Helicobacter sp. TaxID=218 RepID=UPI0019A6E858|nr:phage minor head protein [Helicobacter sp.]MBD5164586.1 minor capsid protein [Helicobacter sp.]